MKGSYAAYKQLTPAVPRFDIISRRAAEIYSQLKAKEDAKANEIAKKYQDYITEITEYESDFKPADVNYRFNDEMMRVSSIAQDELYDIFKKKTYIEKFGDINSKKYRDLKSREQEINKIPDMFKNTFKSYNEALEEYNKGKGTKYDEILNADLEVKLLKTLKDNSWKFDTKTLEFEVKDPGTGEVKKMSAGQFASNPLIYGTPKLKVDIPNIAKDFVSQIGEESRSYYDPLTESQVTIKKSEASGRQKQIIYDHVLEQINSDENLVEKLGVKGQTPSDFASIIMEAAGFKSGTFRSEVKKSVKEGGAGKQTPQSFWESNPGEIVSSLGVVHYKDGESYEIKNPAKNAVSFSVTTPVSVNPSSVFIMNTSSPLYVSREETGKIKGVSKMKIKGREAEIIEGRTVTKIASGVEDFKFIKALQLNVYQGDIAYGLKFKDEGGKEVSMVLRKGKEIPEEVLSGAFDDLSIVMLGSAVDLPSDYSKAKGALVNQGMQGTVIDEIRSNSKWIDVAVGEGKLGGSDVLVGIPMNEDNSSAISSINSRTRTGTFKDTKGFLYEWRERYGNTQKADFDKFEYVGTEKKEQKQMKSDTKKPEEDKGSKIPKAFM